MPEAVEVFLTRGAVALVSPDDWPLVCTRRWQLQANKDRGKRYAVAIVSEGGRRRKLYMHRVITSCSDGLVVDHANGDGLCNVRENLRVTTAAFNAANCCAFGILPFRGVTHSGLTRYRARINDRHLGYFGTAEEAAMAYDMAAIETWGPFAWLNFPEARPTAGRTAEIGVDEPVPYV